MKKPIKFDEYFTNGSWQTSNSFSHAWENCGISGEDEDYEYYMCWDNGPRIDATLYRVKKNKFPIKYELEGTYYLKVFGSGRIYLYGYENNSLNLVGVKQNIQTIREALDKAEELMDDE